MPSIDRGFPDKPLTVDGLKLIVTPVGWPEAVKTTDELKSPLGVTVIVLLPFPPCAVVTELGDAETPKPEGGVAPVSAAIKPALGLPQPVTRSNPVTAE